MIVFGPKRHSAILSLIFVVATGATSNLQAKTRVFLLAGQSNMSGHGDGDELTGALAGFHDPQTDVNIWRSYQDENNVSGSTNSWIPLAPELGDFYGLRNDPNFSDREPSFGPEVSFGAAIRDAFPNDDLYLIKHAWGATSLAGGWDPVAGTNTGVMTGNNTTPGLQYNLFKSTVAAALTDLDNANIDYEISAMLWMQGESDGVNSTAAAAYEANLAAFIVDMRTNYGPDLPFIIGRINPIWDTNPPGGNAAVRLAQQTVAESTNGVEWFDTDGIPTGGNNTNVHYSTAGQIQLGQAFADTYVATSTPEPTSGMLMGIGGLILILSRRCREYQQRRGFRLPCLVRCRL